LHFSIDIIFGSQCFTGFNRAHHLFHQGPFSAAIGRETEESDIGSNAEGRRRVSGSRPDGGQGFHIGVNIHGAVGVKLHIIALHHKKHRRGPGDTRFGADNLKSGNKGLRLGSQARDHPGSKSLFHQHGAKIMGFFQNFRGFLGCHALGFTQLHIGGNKIRRH